MFYIEDIFGGKSSFFVQFQSHDYASNLRAEVTARRPVERPASDARTEKVMFMRTQKLLSFGFYIKA